MKPHDMGVLFDQCADHGTTTRVHLDRPFDIAPGDKTDYTVMDLAALVVDAAGWLAAAGAGRGDRVAIVKDNHWDYACWRAPPCASAPCPPSCPRTCRPTPSPSYCTACGPRCW